MLLNTVSKQISCSTFEKSCFVAHAQLGATEVEVTEPLQGSNSGWAACARCNCANLGTFPLSHSHPSRHTRDMEAQHFLDTKVVTQCHGSVHLGLPVMSTLFPAPMQTQDSMLDNTNTRIFYAQTKLNTGKRVLQWKGPPRFHTPHEAKTVPCPLLPSRCGPSCRSSRMRMFMGNFIGPRRRRPPISPPLALACT